MGSTDDPSVLARLSTRERPYDVLTDGIPQNEATATRAGISWELCQRLQARQDAVAACRRRGAQRLLSDPRRYGRA